MFHPAACFLLWLFFALGVQIFSAPVLIAAAVLLLMPGAALRRRWWKMLWRAKWLLLSLWLILAYGTPGEFWLGLGWAPTLEGMGGASLHATRLMVLIGSLAWLFELLPQEKFLAALWVLTQPFGQRRSGAERMVIRLALVFDYLQQMPEKNSWRHFLTEMPVSAGEKNTVTIQLPLWQAHDWMMIVGGAMAIFVLGYLS